MEPIAAPQVWQVPDTPSLSIGENRVGFTGGFYGIVGVARLADGRIVVADQGQRLLFFDPAGALLTTVGREGEGPGEFRRITWVQQLPADSLLVYDGQLRRASIFTSNGALSGEFRLLDAPPPRLLGRFADGTWLSHHIRAAPLEEGIARPEFTLLHHDADGGVLDTLVTVPGSEVFFGGQRGPYLVRGVLRETHIVVGAREAYVATGDRFEVVVVHTELSVAPRMIERSVEPVMVTDAHIEAQYTGVVAGDVSDRWPPGQTLPLTLGLLLDDANDLWVEEYRLDRDEPGTWSVFDVEGQFVAIVRVPARVRPFHVGADFVLGVWRDGVDVEHVRLYRLEKPLAARASG